MLNIFLLLHLSWIYLFFNISRQYFGATFWCFCDFFTQYICTLFLCLFIFYPGSILVCYILVYVWFVLRSLHRAIYLEENRDRIVKVKFTFGFLLSFFLDIPGSCITVGLYSMRCGSAGLHCWDCAQDAGCTDKRELRHRVYISQVVVVVMFFGLCMVRFTWVCIL